MDENLENHENDAVELSVTIKGKSAVQCEIMRIVTGKTDITDFVIHAFRIDQWLLARQTMGRTIISVDLVMHPELEKLLVETGAEFIVDYVKNRELAESAFEKYNKDNPLSTEQ